ncbi:carbohydrate ABC transporter permease [Cohnella candidum]|uniref:Carbohydrate ABC transporter permease n=1 Tax=Cohnella candidum TaxID=2674991 RepID=A0A3G3JZU7_9BACL|nr:carbohydrate ABC transporter permease [Cohnella candidum]AYQ73397.1 carbohydrate ABC transporter permease [Cohnella candidum]
MKGFRWLVIVLFLLVTLVPFLWLILASFKTSSELFSAPFKLPEHWSWDNYRSVLESHPIPKYFFNSLILAVSSTILAVAIATLVSYAFMYKFKFKPGLLLLITFGIFIPTNAFLVPYYFIVNWIGLYDSLAGVALVYAGVSLPLSILIVKTYMESIQHEILEASFIDGASVHRTFFNVILPISYPGMTTASIFLMITAWNELLFANLLTQSEGTRTLQVAIRFFLSTFSANYPVAFAAMVIAVLPTILIYSLLSEKIIGGLTAGAVK